jgi:hypothetical protein
MSFAVAVGGAGMYQFSTFEKEGQMKKLFAIVFSFSLMLSLVVLSAETASAAEMLAAKQVGYLKRKTKKVYYRSKRGTKYVAHKTKRGTKKTFHKSKRKTKKVYSKSKDAVTN